MRVRQLTVRMVVEARRADESRHALHGRGAVQEQRRGYPREVRQVREVILRRRRLEVGVGVGVGVASRGELCSCAPLPQLGVTLRWR